MFSRKSKTTNAQSTGVNGRPHRVVTPANAENDNGRVATDDRGEGTDKETSLDGDSFVPRVFGSPSGAAAGRIWRAPDAPVADTCLDGWSTDDVTVRSVSSRGYAHRFGTAARQDAVACAPLENGSVALVVADGVSNADNSHVTSGLAARIVIDELRRSRMAVEDGARVPVPESLSSARRPHDAPVQAPRQIQALVDEDAKSGTPTISPGPHLSSGRPEGSESGEGASAVLSGQVIEAVDAKLKQALACLAIEANHMATTLSVAVVEPCANGEADVWLFGVGDSPVYVLDRDEQRWQQMAPLSDDELEGGLVVSNATDALPNPSGPPWELRFRMTSRQAVLVMSDGVGKPLGAGGGELGAHLASQWSDPPDPFSMAVDVNFQRRSFNDDRTVAGAWLQEVQS